MAGLAASPTTVCRRDALIAAALVVAVLALYWPVRHFNFVRVDDPLFIFDNPRAVNGLTRASAHWAITSVVLSKYMPVAVLSLLADISLWGLKPGPMHMENAVLHAMSTAGWYVAWVMLTGRRGRSFLVAAVFGLHPMHVEPVAWISARGDLLCMPLLVGSLLAYLRFVRTGKALFYLLATVLYPAAMLAKTVAMVFPIVLVLLNVWPLRRLRRIEGGQLATQAFDPAIAPPATARRFAWEMTPFVLVAIAGGAIGLFGQVTHSSSIPLNAWPAAARLANVVFGYSSYLIKLFWPEPMLIIYPLRTAYSGSSVAAAATLLFLLTAVLMRIGLRRPYLIVGWIWFLGTLLPTIGFVQVGMSSMADRYTYLPYVGLSVAIVWATSDVWSHASTRLPSMRMPIASAVCGLVLLASAVESRRQLHMWQNSFALFSHALEFEPDYPAVNSAMGNEYRLADRPDLAIVFYGKSLSAQPDDGDTQTNLAGLLMRVDPAQALPHFDVAARLQPSEPSRWWNLGICQQQMHRDREAAASFHQALRVDPNYEPARASLRSLSPGN